MVVLGWLVLQLTNSAFLVGLAGALQWGPMLLGAFTGLIADRFNRRVVLIVVNAISAITCLVLGFLITTGIVQTWHIMLLSLIQGIAWAIDWPCRRSMIPSLAGETNVLNGMALDNVARTSMSVLGSIAGGQFIVAIGMGNSYYLIGAIYLAATLFFFLIRKITQVPLAADTSIVTNILEGIKYIFQSKAMLSVLAITILMNFFFFPYRQLLPIFARDILKVGPSGLGYLAAAQGMGSFVSSTVVASLREFRHRGLAFLSGAFISALLLFVFANSVDYPLSLGSLIACGFAVTGFSTLQSTILLTLSTEQLRGRIMGVVSLTIGVSSIGILVFGAATDKVGAPLVVGASAVINAVLILVILSMPALRRLQ